MAIAATAYFAMLPIFREPGRGRMWAIWYVGIPVAFFVLAALVAVIPLRGAKESQQSAQAAKRTGIELLRGRGKVNPPRIRNMDIGIRTEDTEYDIDEADIS